MLAFADQSGCLHPNDPVKRPVLLTLCMDERDVGDLTRRIHNIKERIFGPEDENNPREIKSVNLLNPKSLTVRTNNKQLTDEVLNAIAGYNVAVFAAVMERPNNPLPIESSNVLPNRYRFLLERISHEAERRKDLALLVFDEESKDKIMWKAINNYLFKHNIGKTLHILEMPLFVKSIITPGVQVADLMAGVVRHFYELDLDKHPPNNGFEKWIAELYSIINQLTYNYLNERNTKNFGIFLMPRNNY
ncbi:DUF3800 domain-containing protein [Desulforamulus putei]|uniref:DUF3800 domain-containing protein n=1 Tax=Desulforamulus putei DSM 12395 TaxID=1121429 RepID=A0A1M4Y2C2_9FIRM|nr:DUF3800 domain-containing protein [Desulforamulus putei]SHE99723.1 Protein of unknown function [Desulforamulus putei DSM 12395]